MFDRDDNPCDACPWPCAECSDSDGPAPETLDCPCCFGLAGLMGQLGPLVWYQCRDCGQTFNAEDSE